MSDEKLRKYNDNTVLKWMHNIDFSKNNMVQRSKGPIFYIQALGLNS